MKKIIILGSTGSVGRQTLDVVRQYPGKFEVIGLSAHSNKELLAKQAEEFSVKTTTLTDPTTLASQQCDLVVNAISGLAGLEPTLAAINAGNKLALANKESIVAAGEEIMSKAKLGQIIPIDSEHSAIFQILEGRDHDSIKKIIITCSGGPFFGKKREELQEITPEQALAHPTWSMGRKISIDSATWMNKGFEVIEAHHLFQIPYEKIEVLVHPQSIVHGIVEFKDGSTIMHASPPDMKGPISAALLYPEAPNYAFSSLELANKKLDFFPAENVPFQGINLALKYASRGRELVAANDKAVYDFLEGNIGFLEIYEEIERRLKMED